MAEQNIPPEDFPLPDSDVPLGSPPQEPGPIPKNSGDTGAVPDPVESTKLPPDTAPQAPEVSSELEWNDDADWDDEDFDFGDLFSPDLPATIASEEAPKENVPEMLIPEKEEASIPDREYPQDSETPPSEGDTVPNETAFPPVEDASSADLEDALKPEASSSEGDTVPDEVDLSPAEDFSFADLEDALKLETPLSEGDTVPEDADLPPVEDASSADLEDALKSEAPLSEEDTGPNEADISSAEDFSFDDLEDALKLETPPPEGDAGPEEADLPPVEDTSSADLEDALKSETPLSEGDTVPDEVDLPPAEDFSFDDLEDALKPETPLSEGNAVLDEADLPPAEDVSFGDLEDVLKPQGPPSEEDAGPDKVDLPPAEDVSFDDLEDALKSENPPPTWDAVSEEAPSSGEDISSDDLAPPLPDDFQVASDSLGNNPVFPPFNQEQDNSIEGLPPDTFDPFKIRDETGSGEPGPGGSPPFSLGSLDEDLAAIKPSPDVEEIELSDEELVSLNKTLESYPLNLRIACEEAIAEQAVDPALMSKLIKSLVKGASVKEMVPLVGKVLGRIIIIPKNFEKRTGEAREAAHADFSYIFVHKFLPLFRLFLIIALVVVSLGYLAYRFVYTPIRADLVYKKGYAELHAGNYSQANEGFKEALRIHPLRKWFYRYAEGFRDARQYIYAEEKYEELLRYFPRDKQGVLDYASMETNHLNNYAKADSLLRRNILDYAADDKEGLLAVGDNALAWGTIDPKRYEDARDAYARYLERYGWVDPVVERMLKYFIRTDNLKEVLPLQAYFMDNRGTKISPGALAELGGYLLDKKLQEVRGVPNEYISYIDGIRDILTKAAEADPALPEPHYHLARYYNYFDNVTDERITLERALKAFDAVREEPVQRLNMRIDAERQYAQLLMNQKEFFAAEEHLVKGLGLYEDGVNRQILSRSPQFGRLYADLGDLAYFTQEGNMARALEYYVQSEQNGWAPPEVQYRMGAAHYHQRQWAPALERFFAASSEIPLNRRLLNALGSASYMRGDYFTAQGYYSRLLDLLHADRIRFTLLLPNERPDHLELVERLMVVWNNLGVALEALTEQTGDNRYRSQAMGLYTESARAWDTLTRNPETLVRSEVVNLAFLNSRNSLHPEPDYEPQIYIQIDKDVLEPSPWETLAPQNFRLSDGLF
ncbi:MAG: tetratricopeptide repeat protein [Treponema sp.]|nr:tetratricopeptide repeat protein [Treponema sp.]